jgi:hypothetical protein
MKSSSETCTSVACHCAVDPRLRLYVQCITHTQEKQVIFYIHLAKQRVVHMPLLYQLVLLTEALVVCFGDVCNTRTLTDNS